MKTFLPVDPRRFPYVLENLDELVVKSVERERRLRHAGRATSTQADQDAFAAECANPRGFIAQPTLALSAIPVGSRTTSRAGTSTCAPSSSSATRSSYPRRTHRVAIRRGSLVVNSSQGGGSKDTWVLADVTSRAEGEVWGPMLCRVADDIFWMSRYVERAIAVTGLSTSPGSWSSTPVHDERRAAFWLPLLGAESPDGRAHGRRVPRSRPTSATSSRSTCDNPSSLVSCYVCRARGPRGA